MLVGFCVLVLRSICPAGEHSPFDSSLWTRLLRCRLMRRWSFSHVEFCAGSGRFRKRTGVLCIHSGAPSPSLDHHISSIGRILDKMTVLVGSQYASTHCCLGGRHCSPKRPDLNGGFGPPLFRTTIPRKKICSIPKTQGRREPIIKQTQG